MEKAYRTAAHASPTDLSGLRIAITGGTSGLGLALVRDFVERGAQVATVARDRERLARVTRELCGLHGIVGDVSEKRSIHRIALQILGELGGLDVLINNASSLGPNRLKLLADTECEELEQALATNLLGPFRLTKVLLGALAASARDQRGGVVLNISSDAAVNAYPRWGANGASKSALLHLSRIWNEELASEAVHVLSIDPGDMDTPLHAIALQDADRAALRRPAQVAREIAETIIRTLPRAINGRTSILRRLL